MVMLSVMWLMTAVVVGFMLGRVSMYGQIGSEEDPEDTKEQQTKEGKGFLHRGKAHQEEERESWSVGSPVSGFVAAGQDGERPAVVIEPDCDCVYAPAGGKVTRLYPMGNAFRMTTDYGAELYVQVGDGSDELMGSCYRPRIMQNEIVGKGKLLIEFDRQGLEAAGSSCQVSVCVEGCRYGGSVKETAGEQVKIGEEIFRVQEPAGQEVPFRRRAFE
ncbi:MAG: PTS glucose transporter subunit IIA [Lachnospiraceae bacterium]|nr:PTS glucose transporter subunit IIA [Lachnospiraceae bacterium]